MNKTKKEFGQLSGEELFKPITKTLEPRRGNCRRGRSGEGGGGRADYAMDEFDRTNPFGADLCQRLKHLYQHLHRCVMIMKLTIFRHHE